MRECKKCGCLRSEETPTCPKCGAWEYNLIIDESVNVPIDVYISNPFPSIHKSMKALVFILVFCSFAFAQHVTYIGHYSDERLLTLMKVHEVTIVQRSNKETYFVNKYQNFIIFRRVVNYKKIARVDGDDWDIYKKVFYYWPNEIKRFK